MCRSNIGDGGNKEGPDKKYYPQPRHSAFREPSFGHGTLDLLDATHAGKAGRGGGWRRGAVVQQTKKGGGAPASALPPACVVQPGQHFRVLWPAGLRQGA